MCDLKPALRFLFWGGVLVLMFALIFVFSSSLASAFPAWEYGKQPEARLTGLIPHPSEEGKLLVSSGRHIYEEDSLNSWKKIWSAHGSSLLIHKLVSFSYTPQQVFVLTTDGVWLGDLNLGQWKQIYSGKNNQQKNALAFLVLPEDTDHWFVGTENGVLESDDAGKTWFPFTYFNRDRISVLDFAGNHFFVGTQDRLYISEDFNRFHPVFSLISGDAEEFLELEDSLDELMGEEENLMPHPDLFDMTQSDLNQPPLWLATKKGVFESRDGGRSWKGLSQSGLRSTEIRQLLYSIKSQMLFAGTRRGVYVFKDKENRWQELYQGLIDTEILSLTLVPGNPEALCVITAKGLSRLPILSDQAKPEISEISGAKFELFRDYIQQEPTARQIQEAAIRYNNLKNGKIKRWHRESRLAALLPNFSFGRDVSQGNNIDLDRASTNDPDQFIFGPDDVDRGWDMDLSWDFSDFIWSSSQTSIDSREKLMVELRQDFLAETTRIYYERRRLQMEIILTPSATEWEHWERLNRLEELTSLLDAMTGGFLSKKIETIYRNYPRFQTLWALFLPDPTSTARTRH